MSLECALSMINSIVNQGVRYSIEQKTTYAMARKKEREAGNVWLRILVNPTLEMRSSRKDKYPLHGLKLYKMFNGKFTGLWRLWAIRRVGIVLLVCACDMFVNMSAVNFGREWRLFYRPEERKKMQVMMG